MFYIDLWGRWPQQRRFEDFTENCVNHLFKRDLKRDICIDVYMKRDLGRYLGLCDGDRSSVLIEVARNYEGEKESLDDLALTLAHELVHAKQFIRGEINDRNYIYRRGPHKIDCSKTPYSKQPWEIEAYDLQSELYALYW